MQNDPWYTSLGGILWGLTRYVFASFMVIGGPTLVVYGAFHPREADIAALQLRSGQVPVLVGVGGGRTGCAEAESCGASGQRLYLVFPQSLLSGEVAVINESGGDINVERRPFLAYMFLVIWGGCLYLTWRFCVYALLQASNNRFERARVASSLDQ